MYNTQGKGFMCQMLFNVALFVLMHARHLILCQGLEANLASSTALKTLLCQTDHGRLE